MAARVFIVGGRLPGAVGEEISFRSDNSLFDADIVIFTPTFVEYTSYESYAGKSLISEGHSPMIFADCAHWRKEIETAVNAGKVVFVMLTKPEEVYYHTGEQSYSGTGRSRVTTNLVALISSYDSLPFHLEGLTPRGGTAISILNDLGPLSIYWNQFSSMSIYEVYFDSKGIMPLLGTKNREKVVGGLIRTANGGAIVLLPPLSWDEDALSYTRGKSELWRKEAIVLGNQILTSVIAASDAIRRQGKRTPVPEWAAVAEFSLPVENALQGELADLNAKMAALVEQNAGLQKRIEKACELRSLLYESGPPLESAVREALRLLGFKAEHFRDADSEFDAVFVSEEGRFLGEAEGKDTKAVNINKMSQLERNIQEDFNREEVTEYAKGVLFGNAFRLELPSKRGPLFTQKCITAAKRLKVALVRTPDLFSPARYLSYTTDPAYAESCRQAIFSAEGTIVEFPAPPATES